MRTPSPPWRPDGPERGLQSGTVNRRAALAGAAAGLTGCAPVAARLARRAEILPAPEGATPAARLLARYLTTAPKDPSPLRALAHGDTLPEMLRGGPPALALRELDEFRLPGGPSFRALLGGMYAEGDDAVAVAGRQTLETLDALDPNSCRPRHGASYPDSDLANGLRQVALLLRANVGLEAACLDYDVWDTPSARTASIRVS